MAAELLRYFVETINSPLRKEAIARINAQAAQNPISDTEFSSFLMSASVEKFSLLTEGPTNCVLVTQFHSHLTRFGNGYFKDLVKCLEDHKNEESKNLAICRLLQAVSQIGKVSDFPNDYRLKLIDILQTATVRDLLTQAGYLLCLHFEKERYDHSNLEAIARMSIMRARIAICGVPPRSEKNHSVMELIEFYESFSQNAMQLQYGLQSIALLVARKDVTLVLPEAMRIVELCLRRWDHPLQMVNTACRSLFGQVCRSGSDKEIRTEIFSSCQKLEKSTKRRFNCLFAMVPYFEVNSDLMDEILKSIKISSPSTAAASQLLLAILDSFPLVVREIANHLLTHDGTDIEQLFLTIYKAGNNCMQTLVTDLLRDRNRCSSLLLLRILRFAPACELGPNDTQIRVGSVPVMSRQEILSLVQSSDSELVTLSVIISLRLELVHELETFLICGGVSVVGCCNDDRSVLLNEFTKFFQKKRPIGPQIFNIVWKEGTRQGALQEECQLLLEIVAGLEKPKLFQLITSCEDRSIFRQRMIRFGLTSRWRKVRQLASSCLFQEDNDTGEIDIDIILKKIYESIIGDENCPESLKNEELAAVVIKSVAKSDRNFYKEILNGNVKAITLFGQADCETVANVVGNNKNALDFVISSLLTNIVIAATYLGENCVDSILSFASDLVLPERISNQQFTGSVDCRGHSICSNSVEVTCDMWTLGKASALSLKALLRSSTSTSSAVEIDQNIVSKVSRALAVLLLALKHPALIVPVNEAFAACLTRLTRDEIQRHILVPLLECISLRYENRSNTFQLPLALRRSQGLGPLIACVIKASPSLSGVVCTQLVAICSAIESEEPAALHALNVLRCIVRDASVSDKSLDEFISQILLSAINVLDRLSSENWKIRSSATQLFVQSARRLIGTDNEEDWLAKTGGNKSRKTVTANDFFFNRTGSGNEFLAKIVHIINRDEKEYTLVPILSVLQSLAHLDKLQCEDLIESIEKGICNRSCHVRKLSAKILARLISESADMNRSERLCAISSNQSFNEIHGRLVLANFLIRSGSVVPQIDFLFLENLLIDPKNVPELVILEISRLFLNCKSWEKIPHNHIHQLILLLGDVPNESTARFVLSYTSPEDPIIRDLLVACIQSYPHLIEDSKIAGWMQIWSDPSSLFPLGVASLLEAFSVEPSDEWISSIDLLDESVQEEVRIALAKSNIVRDRFPHIHALLLLDESPEVRLAASVKGQNYFASLKNGEIFRKCDSQFLLSLITESFFDKGNSELSERCQDYALRFQARNLCYEELRERNFELQDKWLHYSIEEIDEKLITQETCDAFHSYRLLENLALAYIQ